jgi:hypothetical protein
MSKPPSLPAPAAGPVHALDLSMTVEGEAFSLKGVFALSDGLAAFDHWAATLGGSGFTPAQLAELKRRSAQTAQRAQAVAAALKALDAETPNP